MNLRCPNMNHSIRDVHMALCPRVLLHEVLFATAVHCSAGALKIKCTLNPARFTPMRSFGVSAYHHSNAGLCNRAVVVVFISCCSTNMEIHCRNDGDSAVGTADFGGGAAPVVVRVTNAAGPKTNVMLSAGAERTFELQRSIALTCSTLALHIRRTPDADTLGSTATALVSVGQGGGDKGAFDGSAFGGGSAYAGSAFEDNSAFDGSTFEDGACDGSTIDGCAFDGSTFDGCVFDGRAFDGSAFDGCAIDDCYFGTMVVDVGTGGGGEGGMPPSKQSRTRSPLALEHITIGLHDIDLVAARKAFEFAKHHAVTPFRPVADVPITTANFDALFVDDFDRSFFADTCMVAAEASGTRSTTLAAIVHAAEVLGLPDLCLLAAAKLATVVNGGHMCDVLHIDTAQPTADELAAAAAEYPELADDKSI